MEAKLKRAVAAFLGFEESGLNPAAIRPLAGDGSQRRFWRIAPTGEGTTLVVMSNPPVNDAARKENAAYLMIGNHLRGRGIPVPEIYRHDLDSGWFIMEDLGDRSLQAAVLEAADPVPLYSEVLEVLFRIQVEGVRGFDVIWCCQTERYDAEVMRRFESGYFRDAFLKNHLGLKDSWPELEGPFSHLADTASRAEAAFLLHRDFQSRNIMLPGSRVGVIDWQGARIGPLGYDLASLLIDPYVGLTPGCADRVFRTYLEHLRNYDTTRVDPFRRLYPYLAVQRNLQMLGAFAHLSRKMGKTTFEAYIPPAVASLRSLLTGLGDPALQALRELAERLAEDCKPVEGRERREG